MQWPVLRVANKFEVVLLYNDQRPSFQIALGLQHAQDVGIPDDLEFHEGVIRLRDFITNWHKFRELVHNFQGLGQLLGASDVGHDYLYAFAYVDVANDVPS